MAHAKRNGSSNGHSLKILKADAKGHSGPKVSSFRDIVLRIFEGLLEAGINDEFAWSQAGPIARASIRQSNFPIASTQSGTYDGTPMNGTVNKSKNHAAQKATDEDPLDLVLSRAVSRLVANEGLTISGAEKKYGLPSRFLYRLVKEATPGRAGENIDKVCKAFGVTRRQIEDLGA